MNSKNAGEARARSLQPTEGENILEDDEATAIVENDHPEEDLMWQKVSQQEPPGKSRSLRPVSSKGLRYLQQ